MAPAIAIVTDAGSGIGRAIARRLARDGAQVVVNDLVAQRASAVAAEIIAVGGTGSAVAGDVSDEPAVAALMEHCGTRFGNCSVLVNNAGHAHHAAFADMATADFDRMFVVHVRGAFLCSRAVLPARLTARHGFIVNVASNLGQTGGAGMVHYSAASLPLPRLGEPDEVAGAVAFLLSADAALFVGQTLDANSGAVML